MGRRVRAVGMAALMAAQPLPAFSQSNHLAFSDAPSPERTIARDLMAAEAKAAIDGGMVSVSAVDLDGDGTSEIIAYAQAPQFCDDEGCLPRIFRKTGGTWRNMLAADTGRTRGGPAVISRIDTVHGGFSDLLLGSILLTVQNGDYAEDRGAPRTELEAAAFVDACSNSPTIGAMLSAEGAGAKSADFCTCMVDQFETAGLAQSDLDRQATAYALPRPVGDGDPLLVQVEDFELGCRIDLNVD